MIMFDIYMYMYMYICIHILYMYMYMYIHTYTSWSQVLSVVPQAGSCEMSRGLIPTHTQSTITRT